MRSQYPTSFAALQTWSAENGVIVSEARVRFAQYAVLRAIATSRRLSAVLVFKGGNALDFIWQPNRSTRDLDFSVDMDALDGPLDEANLRKVLEPALLTSTRLLGIELHVHSVLRDPEGPDKTFVTYQARVGYALQDELALRRRMEKGLPSTNVVPVEISINEPICADMDIEIDAPNPLRVCTVEDIVAEKLRALLQQTIRNRNRAQDLLDIAVIIKARHHLGHNRISQFLLTKSAARSVPVSRAAFKDADLIARASQGYEVLRETVRGEYVSLDEAKDLLYQLVDGLEIPDS